MSENELVTAVITTCRRKPETVKRAIDSVLHQSYENIELIVVDDSPEDYSLRKEVEKTVRSFNGVLYVPLERNMGACAARNKGIGMANGEFVAFLDDDDEWLPQKIEKQLAVFNLCDKKTALVYCGSITVNDADGTERERKTQFLSGKVFDELIKENFIGSTSFPLIRTEALKDVGGFDVDMQAAQDCDLWLRIAEKYEINFDKDVLVRYHIHENGQITSNPAKRIAGLERLNMKNAGYLDRHDEAKWIRLIKLAPCYALTDNFFTAFKKWISAVRIRPFNIKTNARYLLNIIKNCLGKYEVFEVLILAGRKNKKTL